MLQNTLDFVVLHDHGDELHLAAAAPALDRIDLEDALQACGPGARRLAGRLPDRA